MIMATPMTTTMVMYMARIAAMHLKDLEHNELIVGQGNDHPWLFSGALLASEIYWVNPIDLSTPLRLTAKVRYRQSDQPCTLEKTESGYRATFDDPQRAVHHGYR